MFEMWVTYCADQFLQKNVPIQYLLTRRLKWNIRECSTSGKILRATKIYLAG